MSHGINVINKGKLVCWLNIGIKLYFTLQSPSSASHCTMKHACPVEAHWSTYTATPKQKACISQCWHVFSCSRQSYSLTLYRWEFPSSHMRLLSPMGFFTRSIARGYFPYRSEFSNCTLKRRINKRWKTKM